MQKSLTANKWRELAEEVIEADSKGCRELCVAHALLEATEMIEGIIDLFNKMKVAQTEQAEVPQ